MLDYPETNMGSVASWGSITVQVLCLGYAQRLDMIWTLTLTPGVGTHLGLEIVT